MNSFPTKSQRKKYYQDEGKIDYQNHLYGNPSDWIHHRIKNLSLKWLKSILREMKKPLVLDIGCAEGLYLREINSLIQRGRGIDIALNKIKRARKKSRQFSQLEFVSGDFLDHQFKEKKFNLIFSTETLEHIPDIEKTLRKINSLLSGGGIFLVSVPTDKEAVFYRFRPDWKKASGHLYNWSKKEFIRLLERAGFEVAGSRGVNNVATQIIAKILSFILRRRRERSEKEQKRKIIGKEIKGTSISQLTKGAKIFYQLDSLFTSLPILKRINNYNIFICQKK